MAKLCTTQNWLQSNGDAASCTSLCRGANKAIDGAEERRPWFTSVKREEKEHNAGSDKHPSCTTKLKKRNATLIRVIIPSL